jgi:hypothetical protein
VSIFRVIHADCVFIQRKEKEAKRLTQHADIPAL